MNLHGNEFMFSSDNVGSTLQKNAEIPIQKPISLIGIETHSSCGRIGIINLFLTKLTILILYDLIFSPVDDKK